MLKESYENFMASNQFPLEHEFGTPTQEQEHDFCEAVTKMIKESGLRSEGEPKTHLIYTLLQNANPK